MKTDMNWVWHNLFYLFNSQLNFDAKNSSKALQRRYLRNKSLWWPFQTNHQLLSAIRNRTTYNCKVKHSQVLSGAHCPAAIFNSFTLLITFVESFKYNMVKKKQITLLEFHRFLDRKRTKQPFPVVLYWRGLFSPVCTLSASVAGTAEK